MNPRYIRGVSVMGYGASMAVGIGIPIPIIDEDMIHLVSIKDEEIYAPVVDYSKAYPSNNIQVITYINYGELRSGQVEIKGEKVPTASLSSYPMAREIANKLKSWILEGEFLLTEKTSSLPGVESGQGFNPLKIRLERKK